MYFTDIYSIISAIVFIDLYISIVSIFISDIIEKRAYLLIFLCLIFYMREIAEILFLLFILRK